MPGAKKSRVSKQARSGKQRSGRKTGTREPLPVLVIVCDDARTAPAYFTELKREVKAWVALDVCGAKCGDTSPDIIAEQACSKRALLEDDPDENDAVWAILDLEADKNRREKAAKAKRRAEAGGVKVALSDPCYEVWTLLHLEDTGQQFGSCRDVLARVKRRWKIEFAQRVGKKAQLDYSKIVVRCHEAAARAKPRWERNDPSRTEVFKIIQAIDKLVPS